MSCPHGNPIGGCDTCDEVDAAFEAGKRSALAEQQEPVAVWELFEDGWDSIADPEWMETLPVGTKLYTSPQPAQPQQEPVAFEIAYARALKESNSGTLKDIAKLCYQAALIVQPAAPVSQKPSWYHKHWGDGDDIFYTLTGRIPEGATPLYTFPPAQRKPLTDEQVARVLAQLPVPPTGDGSALHDWAMQAVRVLEKNQ